MDRMEGLIEMSKEKLPTFVRPVELIAVFMGERIASKETATCDERGIFHGIMTISIMSPDEKPFFDSNYVPSDRHRRQIRAVAQFLSNH